MKWKGWDRVRLDPETGAVRFQGSPAPLVDAIAPIIVSASRSTDIPALYVDWFIERLKRGYVTWKSPFDGRIIPVSFVNTRVFVFWSKNPRPFIPSLANLTKDGRQSLFLFTLNDYTREDLEPGIPPLGERIRTFAEISSLIGRGRLTWRFDPLLVSDMVTIDDLPEMARTGATVLGIDWRTRLTDVRAMLGSDVTLQGNLDPERVVAGFEAARAGAQEVVASMRHDPRFIFNLGHGVPKESEPAVLKQLVDWVHEHGRMA